MVNLLLNKGASLSTCDKKDRQPIHWAAFLGRFSPRASVCFFLTHCLLPMDLPFRVLGLPRGRCAQVFIFRGPLALTAVSWAGHLEVLKLLVARGADVMCKDKKGYTLLHTAAASGQIEVVRHLLRLGVEVRPLWLRAGWARVQAGLETGV